MKQTAVEWLIEQLENHNGITRAGFEKCIQDAKEMEKQQIKDAYESLEHRHGENYYNETFKSE
jgi:hypothetical protein